MVWALCVIELKVAIQPYHHGWYGFVLAQVQVLVLHCPPEALDEDVVEDPPASVPSRSICCAFCSGTVRVSVLSLPAYTTVQETIIGKAMSAEEHRLVDLLQTHLTPADCAALEALFEQQDGRYRLIRLQRVPKDLSHGQLRRERARAPYLLRSMSVDANAVLPAQLT